MNILNILCFTCFFSVMWLIVYIRFMYMTHYALHVAHYVCTPRGNDPIRTPCGSLCVYISWKWPIMHFNWLGSLSVLLHACDSLCTPWGSLCVRLSWKWPIIHFMWLIVCAHFTGMTHYVLHLAHCVYTHYENDPLCTLRGSLCAHFMKRIRYALHVTHIVYIFHLPIIQ